MALVVANRVKDTTLTTGTGPITLSGTPPTGYQSFGAGIGNGNSTYYTIAGVNTSEWEVGIGTYTASGTSLSRDTVLSSSNGGALVPFSAGTKDVFVTYPAEKTITNGYGLLPVGNGGTGTATQFTAGSVVFAGTSGVYTQDNANLFWDDTNNRLGIGTATPAYRLDLPATGFAANIGGILIGANGTDIVGNIGALSLQATGANFIGFNTNGSERVRISSTGDVGIGTNAPGTKLDVNGSARVRGDLNVYATGDRLTITPQAAGSGVLTVAVNNTNTAYAPNLIDGLINVFRTGGTERARITSAGNLGIGTTTPASKLDVNGQITVPDQLAYDYTTSVLPDIAPTLNLSFVQSGVVDPRITFTRGSTATFVGSNGLIQTAAVNAPRLDYDPVTRAPKGLLIEEQRINLLVRSQEFDNASWGATSVSVGQNAATSPDGTANAESVTGTAVNDRHYVRQSQTVTSSTSYAFTAFVKANGYTVFALREGNTTGAWAQFDISAGTVRGSGNGGTGSIQSIGNGWYRCSLVCTTGAAQTSFAADLYLLSSAQSIIDPGNILWTPNGTSGIYLWGAQLEAGAFATSYIPTVASQVTRTADAASMTGTNFSSWYNQAEGTLLVEGFTFALGAAGLSRGFAGLSNGTSSESSAIYNFGSSTLIKAEMIDDSTSQAAFTATIASQPLKVAYAYAPNNSNMALNGTAQTTDTVCTIPTVNRLVIGSVWAAGDYPTNGHIRSIQYYPQRLANTVLQGITG